MGSRASLRNARAAIAAAAAGLAVLSAPRPVVPAGAPNVLLVSVDTLRADHVGVYGYGRPTTPNIDALAARGARFLDATSTSAWTAPAHASIFTGRYPSQVGVISYRAERSAGLHAREETLAEILGAAGFETHAFTAGGYVSAQYGFSQGFAEYREWGWSLRQYLDPVLQFIGERDRRRPFFLFLHGYDAHHPYVSDPAVLPRFTGSYRGRYDVQRFCRDGRKPKRDDLAYVVARYDAAIATFDAALGRVLARLRETGDEANTLVVLVADHGEELYDRGGCDHVDKLHQEVVRVPMIMAGPGVTAGTVVRDPVSLVDVAPTILSAVGRPVPPQMEGVSLLAALRGETLPARKLLVETGKDDMFLAAVRDGPLKLLADGDGKPDRLYDLARDPRERTNLLLRRPVAARSMAAALLPLGRIDDAPEPSPEVLERLRALGYVQ